MKVYVVYRVDKYIVGSGYFMPLDMHVFETLDSAKKYIYSKDYIKSIKRKAYGISEYHPNFKGCNSIYIMEEIDTD